MAQHIKLDPNSLHTLRTVDPRLMSYNVEMTEITGGTFWKAYTPGQIVGTEEFPPIADLHNVTAMASLMQWYNPIDLSNEKLRKLAKNFGPVWVRVSGSWATKTYYDFDGHTGGKAPEGFQAVLSKEQWMGVLDFVKAVDGKLLVSVGNCAGNHPNNGPLDLSQTELLFNFSAGYGVPIAAAEFMNEPNSLAMSGAPMGYTSADYVRDHDLFNTWVREHYPDCLLIGPCTTGDPLLSGEQKGAGGLGDIMPSCTTHELMKGAQVKLDVFSYHCYNGCSERLAALFPEGHWGAANAHTDTYLSVAPGYAMRASELRDTYVPGGQMWVTESGDAGGGGCTWASTYLDVLRTLNELGSFAAITDGVIFHNTLASSDYGFLEHGTFNPRPNYFAALLWNTLMGTTVYDCGNPNTEGAHIFCHSRQDGKDGCVYLVINNSLSEVTTVELPKEAEVYALAGKDGMRSTVMTLNGRELVLGENNELPEMNGKTVSGIVEVTPGSCAFIVL